VFQSLKRVTDDGELSVNFKFNLPALKVGGLNGLMVLSDDLGKSDVFIENVTKKVANQLFDVLESKEKFDLTVNNVPLEDYLQKFAWDEAKYSSQGALKDIVTHLHEAVSKIDDELRTKIADFQQINNQLMSETRKQGQNLLTKDLSDIQLPPLSPKQEVADALLKSEYLEVIYIVVPKTLATEFLSEYEKLTTYVVPRSAEKMTEDGDYVLYRLVLFSRVAEEFKRLSAEKKWTVRPYKPDQKKTVDKKKLEAEREKSRKLLIRLCRSMFSEVFAAWTHLKAIRIFVESVLRYGLPTNFQAVLMLPNKSKVPKLRKALGDLYAHLQSKAMMGGKDDDEDFFPYVFSPFNLEFKARN